MHMTNNHCPKEPATIVVTREIESDIHDFAVSIMDKITEFAEEISMDRMIFLNVLISDSWSECPICETRVCETQGKAYSKVVRQVMEYLESEF